LLPSPHLLLRNPFCLFPAHFPPGAKLDYGCAFLERLFHVLCTLLAGYGSFVHPRMGLPALVAIAHVSAWRIPPFSEASYRIGGQWIRPHTAPGRLPATPPQPVPSHQQLPGLVAHTVGDKLCAYRDKSLVSLFRRKRDGVQGLL
jgi:hypothetical protein